MKWRPKEGAGWREEEERDAALEGQQREERFYCILAHCVCVCVLHATPVGSCLIC